MPIRVNVPTRIRVDLEALRARQGCLEEALAAALGRALAHARARVLAPRGGYLGVRLHAPAFTWTGPGLAQVPAALREAVTARLAAVFPRAAERAGLADFAHAADAAPEVLPPAAAEPFDPGRYEPARGVYQIPSYQGDEQPGGTWNPAEVSEEEAAAFIGKPAGKRGYYWPALDPGDEFTYAFNEALAWHNLAEPETGYLGAIYKRHDGKFWIRIVRYPEGDWLTDEVPTFFTFNAEAGELEPATPDYSPEARFLLKWQGEAKGPEEQLRFLRKVFGPEIRSRINEARKTKPDKRPLEEAVKEGVEKLRSKLSPDASAFVTLNVDGQDVQVLAVRAEDWPHMDITLVPVSLFGEVPAPAPGPGQGPGGAGEGEKAGPGEKEGGRGGFIKVEGEGEGEALFPPSAEGEPLECEPYEGEPALEDLGADGDALRQLMEEIAFKLAIPLCAFAGRFCLNAAEAIGARAAAVSDYSLGEETGFLKPVTGGKQGNLGAVDFEPVPSPAIQFMRHLAGVTPLISQLARAISRVYSTPANAARISGFRQGNSPGWLIDFIYDLDLSTNLSVGYIFAMTCRALMLQLLRGSRQGIEDRKKNFATYAPVFEQLMRTQLIRLDELTRMRDLLRAYAPESALAAVGQELFSDWKSARNSLLDVLEGRNPFKGVLAGPPGTIINQNGRLGISDSKGTVWTRDQLDYAIALRTSAAEAIDPLVTQITADSHVMERFAYNPSGIQDELWRLLTEMTANNEEITGNVVGERFYAFRAGKVVASDNQFAGAAGTGFSLTGIHLQAHNAIGDAFEGDDYYRRGLRSLLRGEAAKEELLTFVEFGGVILLSVLCAPLGFIAGVAFAAYHESKALEQQRLFKSLIDPELVLSRAEVEADLFAAELGLVLSFIPEAGTILKGAGSAGRALLKGEARAAAKAFARQAVRRIAADIVKALQKNLVRAFVEEFAKAEAINLLLNKLLKGPMDQIAADFERTLQAKAVLGEE
jgi:hypothetical protein